MSRLSDAMGVIDRQESALFKIACGQVVEKPLSRGDMIDIAEEALPQHLQHECLRFGRTASRKARRVFDHTELKPKKEKDLR